MKERSPEKILQSRRGEGGPVLRLPPRETLHPLILLELFDACFPKMIIVLFYQTILLPSSRLQGYFEARELICCQLFRESHLPIE